MKKTLLIIIMVVTSCIYSITFADDFCDEDNYIPVFLSNETTAGNKYIENVEAQSAVVVDFDSGRVLYEKNANQKRAMASTTKIMTAIVAIENGNLEDEVTISKRAATIGGSTIKLKQNEKYRLRELLYGLLMKSGNDAAIAIAEHIGGNVEKFIEMMNDKAIEIGVVDTHFINPHGLDRDGHYSTAYDLAIMAAYAMKNENFARIVSTSNITISNGKNFSNTNELLMSYPGCNGVKTGYTGNAGRCLVTSVNRNGYRYISAVLGCATRNKRAESSKKILDFCYENYKKYKLINKGEIYTTVAIIKGKKETTTVIPRDTIEMPLMEEEYKKLRINTEIMENFIAPIKRGTQAGYIEYSIDGEIIAQTPLLIEEEIQRKVFVDYLKEFLFVLGTKM